MILDALGEQAACIAGRIAGNAAIVACEPAYAASALAQALTLRRAGLHFSLLVHFEDPRAARMRERSRQLCATYATWDEVRLMLDEFGPSIAAERAAVSSAERANLSEAIRLADTVLVGSWTEYGRLLEALGSVPRDVEIVINADPAVPATIAGAPTDVVVYAPLLGGDELAPLITALGDLQLPVTLIARDAPRIAGRVQWVPPDRAAAALGRARVIVDASRNDPGTALALAKLGRPLVTSAAGGANEALRNAGTYDSWQRRSMLAAVANALGAGPPVIRTPSWSGGPRPAAPPPAFAPGAPLVSVIVATYNRPALLAKTLATIEAQTYPALEIIVVNDAGADVGAVVARSPRARAIDQPNNRGPAAARNRGLAAARGTFAIFFDDDDEMFPDHLAALAHALLVSGLDVAYGQMINCFVVPAGKDRYAIDALSGHEALLDHADIQWAGSLATTAVMFRRSLVERIGAIDERLPAAEDYEFWLRLAGDREWARVDDVTSMYFVRRDGTNRSNDGRRRYLTAHQAIYGKHPTGRPLVAAGRSAMLELFRDIAAPGG